MITPGCVGVYLLNDESQSQIGSLHADNGGEYTSNGFEYYLDNMGLGIKPLFHKILGRMV